MSYFLVITSEKIISGIAAFEAKPSRESLISYLGSSLSKIFAKNNLEGGGQLSSDIADAIIKKNFFQITICGVKCKFALSYIPMRPAHVVKTIFKFSINGVMLEFKSFDGEVHGKQIQALVNNYLNSHEKIVYGRINKVERENINKCCKKVLVTGCQIFNLKNKLVGLEIDKFVWDEEKLSYQKVEL